MTERKIILSAMAGSSFLLLGAFAFQLWGYTPCKLCIWQRWPHVGSILIGVIWILRPGRAIAAFGALSALTGSFLGLYHSGIEQTWWSGPSTCSSGSVSKLSTEALFEQIMSAPLIKCNEIVWSLFNLSMASWNAILSLILVTLWLTVIVRSNQS